MPHFDMKKIGTVVGLLIGSCYIAYAASSPRHSVLTSDWMFWILPYCAAVIAIVRFERRVGLDVIASTVLGEVAARLPLSQV